MNEAKPGPDSEPIVVSQADKRSIVPFAAAAIFALVVLIAVIAGGLLSPAEKNVTTADKLAAAVTNYIDARGKSDLRPPIGVACPGFDEQRAGLTEALGGEKSKVSLDGNGFTNATVNGSRAKVDATVDVNGTAKTFTWNLKDVDGTWLVCAP
ncbi:Rv0361 family membrane protein [Nocardia camponoti]|uniref:Lumazine-binding protein n=1 Tax=Nocardia camponoti TaxID=1616106 RepID=A0A917QIC5_9NOCA|nr:hypothetical protein [Nocardia camponoti]GGK52183.1 hypothetical protein GCM10011591_24860 [Nocardia camponoti]